MKIYEKKYGKNQWSVTEKENYLEFKSVDKAREWGQSNYLEWGRQYKRIMTSAESSVKCSLYTNPVECYCGYSFKQINQYLRFNKDNNTNTYRELADILSIILCSAPRLPCNLVLYRVVCDEFIEELIAHNKRVNPTPVQEKGFMSTSLLKTIANDSEISDTHGNLLKLYVPKGTIGVYVNAVTVRDEAEILLYPNSFLGLSAFPYTDSQVNKTVYECQLISFI